MTSVSDCIAAIRPINLSARAEAASRLSQLTMPHWAMGRLMDLALDLAAISGHLDVPLAKRCIAVFASDHGVVTEGVSQFPQEVTLQMVRNFVAGGAVINAMAGSIGASVQVIDMGCVQPFEDLYLAGTVDDQRIGPGTHNLATEAAMSLAEAESAIVRGFQIGQELAADYDLIATGEMGIGNTTASAALAAVFCGATASCVTGCGSGIDPARLAAKTAVIDRALRRAAVEASQPLRVLAELGGFEIGGLCGLILGVAASGKPIVIDGFITGAAALLAQALCPAVVDYMIASHQSAEPGHKVMLAKLGKAPLLKLGLRLGEGTGAALAMPLIASAATLLTQVKTFSEAAVSESG